MNLLLVLQREAMRGWRDGRTFAPSHVPKKRARFRARIHQRIPPAITRRLTAPHFTAPPSNQAASFTRSSSVMCVTLPIGIAFRRTACS